MNTNGINSHPTRRYDNSLGRHLTLKTICIKNLTAQMNYYIQDGL